LHGHVPEVARRGQLVIRIVNDRDAAGGRGRQGGQLAEDTVVGFLPPAARGNDRDAEPAFDETDDGHATMPSCSSRPTRAWGESRWGSMAASPPLVVMTAPSSGQIELPPEVGDEWSG